MSILGIETEKNDIVTKWVNDTNIRLKGHNIIKNPFVGKIGKFKSLNPNKATYALQMDPIYPNFSLFGIVIFIAIYFSFGFVWWSYPAAFLACLGVFWSRFFIYFSTWIALRKKGYKGKIQYLSNSNVIRGILSHKW